MKKNIIIAFLCGTATGFLGSLYYFHKKDKKSEQKIDDSYEKYHKESPTPDNVNVMTDSINKTKYTDYQSYFPSVYAPNSDVETAVSMYDDVTQRQTVCESYYIKEEDFGEYGDEYDTIETLIFDPIKMRLSDEFTNHARIMDEYISEEVWEHLDDPLVTEQIKDIGSIYIRDDKHKWDCELKLCDEWIEMLNNDMPVNKYIRRGLGYADAEI